jgi:hypothetical protein
MSKNTPGPWRVLTDTLGIQFNVWGDEGPVCAVSSCREALANASLIAAAPDLLNAVDHLLTLVKQLHHGGKNIIISMAEAASAKARGEQQ